MYLCNLNSTGLFLATEEGFDLSSPTANPYQHVIMERGEQTASDVSNGKRGTEELLRTWVTEI